MENKKISKEDRLDLEEVHEYVCKILICTMKYLELDHCIKSTFVSDNYRYKLNFTKEEIKNG